MKDFAHLILVASGILVFVALIIPLFIAFVVIWGNYLFNYLGLQ